MTRRGVFQKLAALVQDEGQRETLFGTNPEAKIGMALAEPRQKAADIATQMGIKVATLEIMYSPDKPWNK